MASTRHSGAQPRSPCNRCIISKRRRIAPPSGGLSTTWLPVDGSSSSTAWPSRRKPSIRPFANYANAMGQSPNPPDWSGYLDWLEVNGDRPLPVQSILRLLEEAGFQSAALDVRGDRGMLIGRRPA